MLNSQSWLSIFNRAVTACGDISTFIFQPFDVGEIFATGYFLAAN